MKIYNLYKKINIYIVLRMTSWTVIVLYIYKYIYINNKCQSKPYKKI